MRQVPSDLQDFPNMNSEAMLISVILSEMSRSDSWS
jgi:hypothetical protein